MDDCALDELPRAYRIGLRLQALGADNALIAECLEIDPESIDTLLDIGAQKLDHARAVLVRIADSASDVTARTRAES